MKNTVLITGGSRGIGKATVLRFLEEGWEVLTTSTDGRLDYQREGVKCFRVDLSKPEEIARFVDENAGVELMAIVNNAGIMDKSEGDQVDVAVLRKVLEVNLIGLVDMTSRMAEKIVDGGRVVNLSSGLGALEGSFSGGYPSYRISKAAVNMYTRCLAVELGKRGIEVCSYEPGWVKTDMGGGNARREPEEAAADIFKLIDEEFENGLFYGPKGRRSW